MSSPAVEAALARYRREHDRYLALADAVASRCRSLAAEADIPAAVQWRIKSPERVRAKLERLALPSAGAASGEALEALGDLAGVRVATYTEAGREPMVEALRHGFRDVAAEVKDKPGSFYRATHCQVRLLGADAPGLAPEVLGLSCEVQVCSLLAEVWNESSTVSSTRGVARRLQPSGPRSLLSAG
jgi:ppGpp synthetase/RelA/SpoT-type nucleotidyltranferase